MKCSNCKKSVVGEQYWQSEDGILCNNCFQILGEEEFEGPIICAICHRQLKENEEYLEEDQTGDCYCMECFEQNKEALIKASELY